ncbi:EVE domain-containing protein [Sphingomonas sp. SUN039]|uniref:EVE domain-containing protein n=1 Tax=Sphingomonas sp. SUN039 TaxID=2937787 RepID=UPI0021640220|nr:EVE domain-containing protein [Sphingomonas sp. SUN039]UVO54673.1 EVE domain-containing protein [Sphingomonas sp. SUN039]
MAYWLVKSEPHKYAWTDMVRDGRTIWDGVRNHTAAINLRAMKLGDRAFFYHSNEGKEIVGIVEIVREHYLDPKDAAGRFPAVDVAPVAALENPVTLAAIKADPALAEMELVRQSRLSVAPVRDAEWARVLEMSR